MSVAKLKLFNLTSNTADMDQVLTRFVDLTWLHPISSSQVADKVHGLVSVTMDNPYTKVLNKINTIEKENQLNIPVKYIEKTTQKLEDMEDFVDDLTKELKKHLQEKHDTLELINKYQDALTQVTHIKNLDISLDDLFSCEYINVRVGIIPVESIDKLQLYQFKPFLFNSFNVENGNCWCIYFSTDEYKEDIDNIFKSLFFRRIHIPDFVHGTPKTAEVSLLSEMDVANENLKEINEKIDAIVKENIDKLTEVKTELSLLSKIYEVKRYVVTSGDKISITGFVEEKQTKQLENVYKDIEGLKIQFRSPDSDKRLTPPTKLKNSWFTEPFSMFLEMYGVPGYHDIDPTAMVAVTYCILFGVMFGDFGQGLLLALLGYILYKWKGLKLGAVGVRIGLTSAFFGLLYGSFFGNEEILLPLFRWFYGVFGFMESPIRVMSPDFTMNILISTVVFGSMLIISSMVMNIITSYRKKNFGELFFSHNGLAGLIFYIFLVGGLFLRFVWDISVFNIFTELIFIVIPLLLIVFKGPIERKIKGQKMFPEKASSFIVDSFFELFEVLLSYVTNTMSFLRVGGFVLSHAGMMMVVFTLMDMSGSFLGTTTIFVLGNLFVMAIEGLIVGIQVLRLEFYEMFSRYFEGNGIPFKPYM